MKKIIFAVLILVLIFVCYWFISPLFIDKKVSEDLPVVETVNEETVSSETTQTEPVSQTLEIKVGTFTGFDRLHTGSGTAKVISIDGKNYLRFEEDFSVTNGPDLYVGLGENGEYIKGSELEKLKGNMGSQNYELPEGTNPEDVKEVWVWCRAFSVPFAKAILY